jgi:chemotaxis protein methyltransferase CheR
MDKRKEFMEGIGSADNSAADFKVEGIIELKENEFQLISRLVYDRFGINLTDKKKALVRGRLHSLVRQNGYASFEEYYDAVMNDESGTELLQLVDRISTNHSYFFREADHFDVLTQRILPDLIRQIGSERKLRIWCAGCAAGEEPYTLAMVLDDFFGAEYSAWDIKILATDISNTALGKALEGVYPETKFAGLPANFKKYVTKKDAEHVEVSPRIKSRVLFKALNLMRESYPFRGTFDIVFCRNVMIYFDLETRKNLLAKFHRYLSTGGYLFIGHSETLGRDTPLFSYVKPTVYRSI